MSQQPSRWQNQPEELWKLLQLSCDNQAQPEDIARLEAILQADTGSQELYLAYLEIHAKLQWRYREETSSPAPPFTPSPTHPLVPPSPRPTVPAQRTPVLGFLANVSRHVPGGEFTVGSLLLLVIVAAFWGLSQAILFPRLGGHDLAEESSPRPAVPPSYQSETVAIIKDTADVEWSEEESEPRNSRSEIAAGQPLSITSGLVELQLKQGVTLLIEGPADWKIDGENSATLTHGKLVAKVPQQAIGFTLKTPTAKIVDLGTEFGVEVAKDGAAEVHVVQGKIDVRNGAAGNEQSSKLKAGQSVQITGEGAIVPSQSPAIAEKFKRLIDAGNKQVPEPPTGPASGLVAYYPFDNDTRDHAAEYAANSGKTADDLKIIGPSEYLVGQVGRALWLTGGYASAPFSADVQLPPTFTVEAWIVADTVGKEYQRLVLCWGDFAKPIYIYHLGIKNSGLELVIGQADGTLIRAAGGELEIERWQHIAGVADGKKLHLYLNGEEVATKDYDGTLFANTQEGLGVGDSAGVQSPSYRFRGAIDELALWNVPLAAEEIAAHVRGGARGHRLMRNPTSKGATGSLLPRETQDASLKPN